MNPNVVAQLALLCYVPAVLLLFSVLRVRTAILTGMIGGWLFLPTITIPVVGIPDFDKIVAANCAVGLGCLCFAHRQLFTLRFGWIDLPMLLWCLAPSLSSLANGLGAYDAASAGIRQVLVWLIPYCIGKTFFRDADALRHLAVAFVIGGLIYVPLCLLEVRLSPQLNKWVYGFHQNQFWRNIRFDGFRPVVFMQNGLMVGVWMATTTVVACGLWIFGERRILRMPYAPVVLTLFVTTILCKALYAVLLMFLALSLLFGVRYGKTVVPALLLLLAIPTYMVLRGMQVVPAESVTQHAEQWFGEDRAQSLGARLSQEDVMITHAMERPVFGWGGWRRSWPVDDYTGDYTIRGLDGLWTITIGQNGLYGVTLLFAVLLTPVCAMLYRKRVYGLEQPDIRLGLMLGICLLLFASDCLLNGMFNPLFIVIAGAILVRSSESTFVTQSESQVLTLPPVRVRRSLRRIPGSAMSTRTALEDI